MTTSFYPDTSVFPSSANVGNCCIVSKQMLTKECKLEPCYARAITDDKINFVLVRENFWCTLPKLGKFAEFDQDFHLGIYTGDDAELKGWYKFSSVQYKEGLENLTTIEIKDRKILSHPHSLSTTKEQTGCYQEVKVTISPVADGLFKSRNLENEVSDVKFLTSEGDKIPKKSSIISRILLLIFRTIMCISTEIDLIEYEREKKRLKEEQKNSCNNLASQLEEEICYTETEGEEAYV